MRGITKRWAVNCVGVIFILLIIIVIILVCFVHNFYYNSVFQNIEGRANAFANIASGDIVYNENDFVTTSKEYVESFPDKELMELMVINTDKEIIITSTGFEPDINIQMPDFNMAMTSGNGCGSWYGKTENGENVLAVSRVINSKTGDYIGGIRYIVSLENVDRQVLIMALIFMSIALCIIVFVFLSGIYFIRSIINPVRNLNETAKRIAQGDFEAVVEKQHDDEIGDLCDTINYMASELSSAEKMKNDFISSVSHELRTPLTAIKGWAETIQLSKEPDFVTMEKGMNVIVKETERLSGIVEELLDFSRIQNNRMILIMDKIDLVAEVDEAVYMLTDRATSEKKHLVFEDPYIPAPVIGDRNRLKQVFMNVIDNAIKYTQENGEINVSIKTDDTNIYVIISDNGCGIPAEHLPKIKEKFYKANQTQRGSGIGLAVADEIIKLHSGTLDIESEENVGTVVTITMPLAKSQNQKLTENLNNN